MSVDDLEGLELSLEILADEESVAAITESLAELDRGDEGVDSKIVRENLLPRTPR